MIGLKSGDVSTMTMLKKLALPEVHELIAQGDLVTLRDGLNRSLRADFADLLWDLSFKEDVVAVQRQDAVGQYARLSTCL